MSQNARAEIIERMSTDTPFRTAVQQNPEAELKGYELGAEERAALMRGDAATLESKGVEARISKFGGTSYADSENASPFATGNGD